MYFHIYSQWPATGVCTMAEKRFLKQKIGFQSILKLFSFNLQMPDKNYDPKAQRKVKTSTISKDSSM